MKTGVIVHVGPKFEEEIRHLSEWGIPTCQVNVWNNAYLDDSYVNQVKEVTARYGIEITAVWRGWSGPTAWNFYEGYHTLGIVPEQYRAMRIEELKRGSDFTKALGVTDMITHMGFLPESPVSPEYPPLVEAIRDLAEYMKENGQYLLFETGQETPVTLLRVIEDVGTGNLAVNLDPANLILYGKANPVDALDVIGKYIRGVHGKDGLYPTNGRELGREVRMGDGKVNFPALIGKLKEIGYRGAITIEREILGEEQARDILYARDLLERLF